MILDGKALALKIEDGLKAQIDEYREKYGYSPCLAVIQVGDNPASTSYVKNKKDACERIGMTFLHCKLNEYTSAKELEDRIQSLNEIDAVIGVILQLPLPLPLQKQFGERYFMNKIDVDKDVDGFGSHSIFGLFTDKKTIAPCTPKGIMRLLEEYNIPVSGKHVVILGRSTIVGKPLALMMLSKNKNATVTICHSKTENLASIIKQADILVAAIGQPEFVKADWVNPNCIIIDVGINSIPDSSKKSGFRLVGDVEKAAYDKASAYTPVPGGVGPMTVAMLLENTLELI